MKKEDEIEFFNYLVKQADGKDISYFQPTRKVIEAFPMHPKRQQYVLLKWEGTGIWEYGINEFAGWFGVDAVNNFNIKNIDRIIFKNKNVNMIIKG